MIDITIINLSSVIISGAGLFSALTKYSVPQINQTFWGENPYVLKRDIIDSVMTFIFSTLTLIGLLLQAFLYIYEEQLVKNEYSTNFYILYFIVGVLVISMVVWLLSKLGKFIAKIKWKPIIIEKQLHLYTWTKQVIENDGLIEDLPNVNREIIIENNYKSADKRLDQFEDLLDIKKKILDRKERITRLAKHFEK